MSNGRNGLRIAVTFHIVCALWVFFRADTFAGALAVFGQIFSLAPGAANLSWQVLAVILAGYALHFAPRNLHSRIAVSFVRAPSAAQAAATIIVLYAVQRIAESGAAPFIYFQF